jgi:restriction system protein
MARFGRSFLARPMMNTLSFAHRNSVLLDGPSLLLQAVLIPGEKTAEGQLVEAVALPWFQIIEMLKQSPETIYEIDWRKWEEIIAATYKRQGFEVTLTPRSNDGGRDIIATSKALGSIRFFDQVKRYSRGHVVTAEEVRAMVGVLSHYPNVSKGIVTTTSAFAPGIMDDPQFANLMPYRLELKGRESLLEWLAAVSASGQAPTTHKAPDTPARA